MSGDLRIAEHPYNLPRGSNSPQMMMAASREASQGGGNEPRDTVWRDMNFTTHTVASLELILPARSSTQIRRISPASLRS
jgi:hypothetical protein